MSTGHIYGSQPGTIDTLQMCGDATAGVVSTDWYTPTSYAYHGPYITPYPSSTVESQPWTQYARASISDPSYGGGLPQQQQSQQPHQDQGQIHQVQQHYQVKTENRPRSSPSTFGPMATDNLAWMTSAGLGIQYTGTTHQSTLATTTYPPNVFQFTADEQQQYSNASSPPEIRAPQPRRPYTSIAPNPAGIPALKRRRDDDDQGTEASMSSGKRRKRTSSVASADLNEDDRFLVELKEQENLPWKDIANRFQTDKGKNFQVAALQMRYKRLREKFRVWEEADMSALKLAHEYWEKYKWEIISAKMIDFGLTERWPARHCARKWQELEHTAVVHASTSGITPALSQFSSPVERPAHFAFMPAMQ